MKARFRKVAVFAGAAALAGGAGIGVASQSGGDAAGSPVAVTRPAGGPRGMDLSALAERLGVSEARLEAALRKARASAAGAPPAAGDDPMAAALADALGLSTEQVSAALRALRPDGAIPPTGSPPPAASDSTTGTTAA